MRNDRFLRALRRQPVDRTPVWIMRQAGRYLPEYRATRQRAGNFLNLCKTPELACEVTLQPLARYALDAAIVFSDILTIPDAMGLGLSLEEGVGPRFEHPVRSRREIEQLPLPDSETELGYVMDAIRLIKGELDDRLPLIGFSGSPWTLASYMVEGRSGSDFKLIKQLAYGAPDDCSLLLKKLSAAIIEYLKAQIAAGVDAIMLFDTWGGILTTPAYETCSLGPMTEIIRGLGDHEVPIILFTKGGALWLEKIATSGCQGVGLDWTVSLEEARHRVGDKVALQGNLDPAVLLTDPKTIQREVRRVLDDFGSGSGHIFNLGHGITPDVPPEHLGVLIDTIGDYQPSPAPSRG